MGHSQSPPSTPGGAGFTRRVVDAADTAFGAIDAAGAVRDWNAAAEATLGWAAADVVGRSLGETLVPERHREAIRDGIERMAAGGAAHLVGRRIELLAVHRDGHEVPVELTLWPAEEEGEPRFCAFIHDVGDRTRRERAVTAHHEVARAVATADTLEGGLAEVLRGLGESLGWDVGVCWRVDDSGELRSTALWHADGVRTPVFDDATVRMRLRPGVGLAGHVLAQGTLAWARDLAADPRYVHAEAGTAGGLRSAVAMPVRSGERVAGVLEFLSRRLVDPASDLADVLTAVGTVIGQFVERREGERALKAAHAAALEASRVKSEVLANTSHEIRTPLNGVIGMAELLLQTDLDDEQREYAETLSVSAQALLDVIDDILDLSKIEAGKLELDHADFALGDVVEGAVALFAEPAHAKSVELTAWLEPAVPAAVRGDAGRLRQILVNLVSNAVKFTQRGEVVVRVRTVAREGDLARVRFEVRDTGIGVAPGDLDRLFESFAQADASTTRRYGGTGLGLSISRRLVGLMGGSIGAESRPAAGSTFWFELPLQTGVELPGGAPATADLEGVHALVVDDNATTRTFLSDQLASWGLRCTTADCGEAGLAALEDGVATGDPFELVLLDLHMPGLDGLTVARRIRQAPDLGSARVLLLTSGLADRGAARRAGVEAQLAKPVRQARLREAVAGALGRVEPEPAGRRVAATQPEARDDAGRPRVLVAEDNPVNQIVVRKLLEAEGVTVDLVADGDEAVAAVRDGRYATVFMDCQMPGVDGYEATRRIRAAEAGARRIPIVALTAHAMDGDRERCLQAGMDDYLSKPMEAGDLRRVLEQWAGLEAGAAPAAPPGAAATDDGDVLDVTVLNRLRADFDDDTRETLLEVFLRQAPDAIATMRDAATRGDAAGLRAAAHRLKGSCLNLGAERMRDLCQRLERLGDDDRTAEAPAVLAELDEAFAATCARLPERLVAA